MSLKYGDNVPQALTAWIKIVFTICTRGSMMYLLYVIGGWVCMKYVLFVCFVALCPKFVRTVSSPNHIFSLGKLEQAVNQHCLAQARY